MIEPVPLKPPPWVPKPGDVCWVRLAETGSRLWLVRVSERERPAPDRVVITALDHDAPKLGHFVEFLPLWSRR